MSDTTLGSIGASDIGSPMAGAVDPATYRRISDLGTVNAGQVPAGMVSLDDPAPAPAQQGVEGEQAPTDEAEMQSLDEPAAEEQQLLEDETGPPEGALTPEQMAAKFQEWQESADIPDEFMDKVMWFDDGKGGQVPMRLRDLPDNVLMYRDYQRKTAEVADSRRQVDRLITGQRMLAEDMRSGDAVRGLRAARYMADEKTLEAMVLQYVNERAELEQLPPHQQRRLLAARDAEIRAHFNEQKAKQLEAELNAQRAAEQAAQGAQAPDIVHVQQHIINTLPSIYKELGLKPEYVEDDGFVYELERVFERAAAGVKGPDGQWTEPPVLQRGRTPSPKLIKQLVLQTKQNLDRMTSGPRARRLGGPKKVAPPTLRGTGPAAQPGQRGNIGQPTRKRWSEMGK